MYRVGDEKRAIEDLTCVMEEFNGESGMRSYFPLGIMQGIIWNKSLYDSSFIRQAIHKHIKPEKIRDSGRHLHIVAVDYSTAQPRVYTEADWKNIRDIVIASCSIPIVFPPHAVSDSASPTGVTYCGDGGMTDFVPLGRALETPELDHVDVVVSVGPREGRILDMATPGKYPSMSEQINTLMEVFYGVSSDRVSDMVAEVNSKVCMKSFLMASPEAFCGMPPGEVERTRKYIQMTKRTTYITARILRPITPFTLTATGQTESVSKPLWNAGIGTSNRAINAITSPQRAFIV